MVGVVVEQRTLCIQVERSAGARVRVYVARVCAEHRRTWWLSAHCGSTASYNFSTFPFSQQLADVAAGKCHELLGARLLVGHFTDKVADHYCQRHFREWPEPGVGLKVACNNEIVIGKLM